jgi:hypothetical protein
MRTANGRVMNLRAEFPRSDSSAVYYRYAAVRGKGGIKNEKSAVPGSLTIPDWIPNPVMKSVDLFPESGS